MSRLPTEIRKLEGKADGVNFHLIFFSTSWPQSGVQIKLRGFLFLLLEIAMEIQLDKDNSGYLCVYTKQTLISVEQLDFI